MVKLDAPMKKPSSARQTPLQKPRKVKILLFVCGCFSNDRVTLITVPAREVVKILRITETDLELLAISAMISRKPQLIGCYNHEIAEMVVGKLEANLPFISPSCHRFFLEPE
jgi:hypothetical protein